MLLAGCSGFFSSGDSIATLAISPVSRLAAVGDSINFTATGTTVNGDSKDVTATAKWTSSNSATATVSAGVATAVAVGNASITASQDNGSATASVIVTSSTLISIAITPTSPTVSSSQGTQQFTATGTFQDGTTQNLTSQVQWSSSNTSVATINSAGLASLLISGSGQSTTITASVTTSSGAVTNQTTLTVD
jgi:hypothetical protein